jgi:hypothetical protein
LDQDLKALEESTLKAGNFKGPEKYTFLIFLMFYILNIIVHDEHGLIHRKSLCSGLFCCQLKALKNLSRTIFNLKGVKGRKKYKKNS